MSSNPAEWRIALCQVKGCTHDAAQEMVVSNEDGDKDPDDVWEEPVKLCIGHYTAVMRGDWFEYEGLRKLAKEVGGE